MQLEESDHIQPLPAPIAPFHIAEFQALHSEVNIKINHIEFNMRFMLGGIAAIWAWLLTNHAFTPDTGGSPALIPIVFTALFFSLISRQTYFIRIQGRYLKKIEEKFSDADLGWESFLSKNHKLPEWPVYKSAIFLLLLAQGLTMALLYPEIMRQAFLAYLAASDWIWSNPP